MVALRRDTRPDRKVAPAHLMLLRALCLCTLLIWTGPVRAENLIQRPGAHHHYRFEIEPQLYFRYGRWADGLGPGVRAALPLMHNGPLNRVNNNIAVSFGMAVPFVDRYGARTPHRAQVDIPIAGQWNFYFTDIISVFGEAGFSMNFWSGPGPTFAMDPLFLAGGRFQFGHFGVVLRAGYPSLSVGANLQF